MTDVKNIIKHFAIYGNYIAAKPFGSGHINDTYVVTFNQAGKKVRYILRKINRFVFNKPELIIENTLLSTNHIRKKLHAEGEKEISRKVLTLVKTKSAKYFYLSNNEYWCVFLFIENAYTVDKVKTKNEAFEAAKAYGKFQKYLSDADISKFNITIENFHNIKKRIPKLDAAIKKDIYGRVSNCKKEIHEIKKYSFLTSEYQQLLKKNIPIRLTHNDTKINNVMLDKKTNKGLCVVDLDTVMPGTVLNDFGDMVRTFVSLASEEEKTVTKVKVRIQIFEALVNGYLSEAKEILTDDEINNLVLGSKIIIYEQAVRFLTDYLEGDVYYKINYNRHNLFRTKNQLELLKGIFKQTKTMEKIVERFIKK